MGKWEKSKKASYASYPPARHAILPTGQSLKVFNKNIIDFQHGISVDGIFQKLAVMLLRLWLAY
jgi:hypothetical protein